MQEWGWHWIGFRLWVPTSRRQGEVKVEEAVKTSKNYKGNLLLRNGRLKSMETLFLDPLLHLLAKWRMETFYELRHKNNLWIWARPDLYMTHKETYL